MKSRMYWLGMGASGVVMLSACGSAGTFANKPRPATPINLTVYINDHRVSVSPARVGAGPVQFIVTNQATRNETLNVVSGGSPVASTSPINPGATANVTVDVHSGEYVISTAEGAGAIGSGHISPATLHIGRPRPNANNALLQP